MKKNSEGTLWSINDNIPIFDSDQTGNSWLTDNYPSMMGFFNSLTASGGHGSWPSTFWQSSLVIGNFHDFCPLLAFDI